MKYLLKHSCLLIFLLISFHLSAQQSVNIVIVADQSETDLISNQEFTNQIQEEVQVLLKSRFDLNFKVIYTAHDLSGMINAFETSFADDVSDIIIASGPMSSNVLAQWSSYSKPAIATIIIDNDLQRIPVTDTQTSGIENFTYVQSPFDVERDLETLYRIHPYQKLGVIGVAESAQYSPALDQLFEILLQRIGAEYSFIPVQTTAESTLNNLSPDVDAVYVLPLFDVISGAEQNKLIKGLSDRNLLSAGLLGEELVEPGILLGYEARGNFSRIPRRVALDISKILEGQNASDLPVLIPTYNETLLINMATAAKIKHYPSWEMMAEATLLKVDEVETDNKWTLRTAIIEALQNNLQLSIAKKDPLIAEKDVALAKAEYLPNLDLSSSFAIIDEATTFSTQGTRGRLSWLASGSLTQLVFSEPAIANIAIQKLLLKGQEAALAQTQLDVILDVSGAYLNVLQAKSNVRIQNENVNVTKRNLDISRAKLAVGYSGATDINRWESELALANINLNNAQAGLRQVKFNFNQLLNRPIDEDFQLEDIHIDDNEVLYVMEPRMGSMVNNPGDLKLFADFMVQEAFQQLPEIQQIDRTISAQNRQMLSQKRAFALPSVAVSAGMDYLIDTWNYPEGLTPIDAKNTWNIGLGLQYPLFQGGKRKINVDQTKLVVLQLEDQKQNLLNQLELLIRANLETVGASYSGTVLSQEASDAADKNFEIILDSYSQGLVNVTTLIDAQNAALQTELTAVNAVYQLIADFLSLERSVGNYYFLDEQGERDDFFQRLSTFISNK